jgi:hypothetical protein
LFLFVSKKLFIVLFEIVKSQKESNCFKNQSVVQLNHQLQDNHQFDVIIFQDRSFKSQVDVKLISSTTPLEVLSV